MKKHSEKKTNVRVNAKDGLTEISIVDSQFNRVASSLGFLSRDLAPGIYKVRWKTASASKDKLIEITGKEGGGVLNLETEMQEINTSAPLNNTKFGCIDKPDVLKDMSGNPPALHPEKACQLLVFLRDEEETDTEFPAESVSVHTADGTKLANLNDGLINTEQRYAGLMIGLDPGVYRLRVETGRLGSYEIFVFTADGWQTRVFLTCDDFYYGSDTFRRPALRTTSIQMGKTGARFDPASHDARLAEIALNALLRGYDILASSDMQGLLHGKFDDPMLGIYGAHLLLQRKRINRDLFDTVCRNLHRLVGPIPDLQALYVKSKRPMRQPDERLSLYRGLPPMLIRSWDLLIRHSRKRFSIIPSGSLSDRIAGSVVSSEPWLMCRVDPQIETSVQPMPNVSFALGRRVMKQMAEQVGRTDREKIRNYLKEQQENLNPIESAILNAVVMADESEGSDKMKERTKLQISGFGPSGLTQQTDAIDIAKNALSNLKVPSYSIARSAVSLASKLKGEFDFDV
jgi:hypothetical protein